MAVSVAKRTATRVDIFIIIILFLKFIISDSYDTAVQHDTTDILVRQTIGAGPDTMRSAGWAGYDIFGKDKQQEAIVKCTERGILQYFRLSGSLTNAAQKESRKEKRAK